MRVLIVRHGESTNNVLMHEVLQCMQDDGFAVAEARWLMERSDDPPLTQKGKSEAQELADHLVASGPAHPMHIYCSPFLRTCQTAWPLFQSGLASRVTIKDDIETMLIRT